MLKKVGSIEETTTETMLDSHGDLQTNRARHFKIFRMLRAIYSLLFESKSFNLIGTKCLPNAYPTQFTKKKFEIKKSSSITPST